MFHPETILHPTDFSDNSEPAFRLACALARTFGAHLILLHVNPPPMIVYAGEPVPVETWPDRESIQESLHTLEKQATGIAVTTEISEGDAADGILSAAEQLHADLIVMGTHGRGALARLLLGGVAERVVRKALCPVMTARPEAVAAKAFEEPLVAGHAK
jgi:nucleotide-binding universal stress UspA family protein